MMDNYISRNLSSRSWCETGTGEMGGGSQVNKFKQVGVSKREKVWTGPGEPRWPITCDQPPPANRQNNRLTNITQSITFPQIIMLAVINREIAVENMYIRVIAKTEESRQLQHWCREPEDKANQQCIGSCVHSQVHLRFWKVFMI